MTRREREIFKASVSWSDKVLTVKEEEAFQAGAKWADKTMIEKIRIWVTERYDLDFMGDFKELLDYLKSLKEE